MEASLDQVKEWAKQPHYGICIIARLIKGIDVDVTNPELAQKIRETIEDFLFDRGIMEVPIRSRSNSPKFLVGIHVPDAPLDKAVIKLGDDGIIEMLSNKQQFIAAGTHPSGVRYEWEGLTPEAGFPTLTREQFTDLWQMLVDTYGLVPEPGSGLKTLKNPYALDDDPVFQALSDKDMVKSEGPIEGSFNIVCPFEEEHTIIDESEKDSSTTYFPAHTGGHAHASIVCLHAHCQERSTENFKRALGFTGAEDFEDLDEADDIIPQSPVVTKLLEKKKKFVGEECFDFCAGFSDIEWLVKHLIPAKTIGAILGAPASGKSFITFDIAAAIARGVVWQDKKTKKGRVLYVCAEGATMFKLRGKAYMVENDIESAADLPISIIPANPNLADDKEVELFVEAMEEQYGHEEIVLIIFDTYAACMIGDENSSKDTGLMIRGLQKVREVFDTTVLAVHHTGKTAGMGARGHSSLPAAFDFELTVERLKENNGTQIRQVSVSKMKDAPDDFKVQFKLKRVLLGLDDDLEEISSCVIGELTDEEKQEAETENIVRLGANQQLILDTIEEYKSEGPKVWPTGDVLIEEILKLGKSGEMSRRAKVKKLINDMVAQTKGVRKDRDDRHILTAVEPLTDENAMHDNLCMFDNLDKQSGD